jgi:hypothetical protein
MPVAAVTAEPVDWIPVLYWLGFSAMTAVWRSPRGEFAG